MCGEGLNDFTSDIFSNIACVSGLRAAEGRAGGGEVGAFEGVGDTGCPGEQRVGEHHCTGGRRGCGVEGQGQGASLGSNSKRSKVGTCGAGSASALELTTRGGFSPFSWWQQGRACPKACRKAFLCPVHPPRALSSALPAGRSQGVRRAAQPQVQVLGPAPPEAPRGGSVLLDRPGVHRHRGQGG